MFETLFSSWKTFRHAVTKGDEDAAFEAYSVFEDTCETVATEGRLDDAVRASLERMEIEDAGEFYSDLLSFASECDLEAMANNEPASVNARVFGIPAMGEFHSLGQLHANVDLVKSVRSSGMVRNEDIVVLVGTLPMDAAARTSPQAVWNLAQQGAHVLAQVHHSDFDHSQVHDLRNLIAVLPDGNDEVDEGEADNEHDEHLDSDSLEMVVDETTVGSGLLVGIRVHISLREEMESDEPFADPLDDPGEDEVLRWEHLATQAMEDAPLCAVMVPLPWRDSLVQSMSTSVESQILIGSGDSGARLDRLTIAAGDDGVVMTGYTEEGMLLGQYRVPTDVSFWALPEIIAQFQGQGMDVELLASTHVDLASMPSPSRMLN